MRIYIIANDGITLSREPPAAVSEGEIVTTFCVLQRRFEPAQ
jgi:hypothetical protein